MHSTANVETSNTNEAPKADATPPVAADAEANPHAARGEAFRVIVEAAVDEVRKRGGPDPAALEAALAKLKAAIADDIDVDDPGKVHAMNIAGDFDVTALHVAAGCGATKVLEVLLTHKASLTKPDLSKENSFGHTPFKRLCKYHGDRDNLPACVALLLDAMAEHAVPDPTLPIPLAELAKMKAEGDPVHEKLRLAYREADEADEADDGPAKRTIATMPVALPERKQALLGWSCRSGNS
jgi:hypothetical protein